jgi:hypothetical protein
VRSIIEQARAVNGDIEIAARAHSARPARHKPSQSALKRRPCQPMTDGYLSGSHMLVHPARTIPATESSHGRRTAIALVSATMISIAVLVLLAVFDVK